MGELPEKSLILIEEESGSVKSIYSLYLASECAQNGKRISIMLTSETADDVRKQMEFYHITCPGSLEIQEACSDDPSVFLDNLVESPGADLIIVEQFSLHFLNMPVTEFFLSLSRIVSAAKAGKQYLLLVDRGVLPSQHEAVLRAMASGILQITTIMEGDKIKRYINIPKMQGVRLTEKMLPFTITDEGFLIDTRERHG